MLRTITEENEASVAKGKVSFIGIAKSLSTKNETSNNAGNNRLKVENAVENTVKNREMCIITDETNSETLNSVEIVKVGYVLEDGTLLDGISLENVQNIDDCVVEIGASNEEFQCVGVETTRRKGKIDSEHDYVVEIVTCETNDDSSVATHSNKKETTSDKSGIVVKKIVLPIREPADRCKTVWPLLHSDSIVKKRNIDPDVSTDGSSMLRTLLLASRNQLKLYQSHSQTSKRLCVASPSTEIQDLTPKPVKRKDFGCQVDFVQTEVKEVCASTTENHSSDSSHSQIKALLLGKEYERVQHCEVLVREESSAECETSQTKKACCDQKYTRNQEHDLNSFLCEVVDLISEYKDLTYSVQSSNNKLQSIEVRRRGLYNIPCPGMTPALVVVEEAGTAHFVTLVKIVFSVACKDKDNRLIHDPLLQLLQKLSIKGGHVFCPGVEAELALVAPSTKNLICCNPLETRYQAKKCLVWHMLGHNQGWLPLNEGVHKCKPCRALERYLRTLVKAKAKDNNQITTFG